jgi:hypothetical protein
MKYHHRKQVGILIGIALFFVQACGTVATISTATPSPVLPTITPIPLSQQVTLTSISFREEGQAPVYTISAQTPKFAGSDDPRAQSFNKKVNDLIQGEIEYFRKNILAQTVALTVSSGSFFDAKYTVVFQSNSLWSLKFDFMGYADGAAHTYHYSKTFNYDLERGEKLSLDDLFRPDSNYLEAVSSYCIFELSKRDIGFYGGFEQGAEPEAKNYRNWNITSSGLMITFDEYQVAPYAAGAQTVIVPYMELQKVIDAQGSLKGILQ